MVETSNTETPSFSNTESGELRARVVPYIPAKPGWRGQNDAPTTPVRDKTWRDKAWQWECPLATLNNSQFLLYYSLWASFSQHWYHHSMQHWQFQQIEASTITPTTRGGWRWGWGKDDLMKMKITDKIGEDMGAIVKISPLTQLTADLSFLTDPYHLTYLPLELHVECGILSAVLIILVLKVWCTLNYLYTYTTFPAQSW